MLSSKKWVLPHWGNSVESIIFTLLNVMSVIDPRMQPFLPVTPITPATTAFFFLSPC